MSFFQFEADFVQSLRCIPMQVRYKLDTCGVKLKLEHWHRFTPDERQSLVDRPCDTPIDAVAYRTFLQDLVTHHMGRPAKELPIDEHPPWMDETCVPELVQEKAKEIGRAIALPQWSALMPIQRFALIKLSRPSHENKNFLPAMKEFGLM